MTETKTPDMLIVMETAKSVAEVAGKVEQACAAHQFGVVGSLDLKAKLREKGFELQGESRIFEVCRPGAAKQVLDRKPVIATAMPCRLAVYEEGGKTRIATLKPTAMLDLFGAPELGDVAQQVEDAMVAIMQDLV